MILIDKKYTYKLLFFKGGLCKIKSGMKHRVVNKNAARNVAIRCVTNAVSANNAHTAVVAVHADKHLGPA